MARIVCSLFLILLVTPVKADRWGAAEGVDCNTYHSFEIPECRTTPVTLTLPQEYSPEQIDFDESRVSVETHGQLLSVKAGVKVAGQERTANFFNGSLSNLPSTMTSSVKAEINRIVDEAKLELERFKRERKKVVLTLARVNIAVPPDLGDSDLRLEGRDFLRTFTAGTTELGQAYDQLMRSNFRTGPRLSSSQKAAIVAKLAQGSTELRQQGIDLEVFTNCLDDRDVCEDLFLTKYVQDNNNGQKQARELLIRLGRLRGTDLVDSGSQQSNPSGAVSDSEGPKPTQSEVNETNRSSKAAQE